ncbi:hypothetical protein FGIG_08666 [Fasciola gigantica]|uniref:Uncharacterized protein n=1 Tax=Fasciola gigantica TaxID=46835 RepID=A0A504YNR8_FASGI|nr:hypothetical protein FGIG_08666 [Fasciola gigantica]
MSDLKEAKIGAQEQRIDAFLKVYSEHPEMIKLEMERFRSIHGIPERFAEQLWGTVRKKISVHSETENLVLQCQCIADVTAVLNFTNEVLQSDLARSLFRSRRLRRSINRLYQSFKVFKRPKKALNGLRTLGYSDLLKIQSSPRKMSRTTGSSREQTPRRSPSLRRKTSPSKSDVLYLSRPLPQTDS